MVSLMEGTDSHSHDFDGCMYGLESHYGRKGSIKKPWRVVSWGVKFDGLKKTCNGSHEHVPCAGRETKRTQMYTDEIVTIILKGAMGKMREHRKVKPLDVCSSEVSYDLDNHVTLLAFSNTGYRPNMNTGYPS